MKKDRSYDIQGRGALLLLLFIYIMTSSNARNPSDTTEIVWIGQFLETVESARLITGSTLRMEGIVSGKANDSLILVNYSIDLDSDWNVISAEISKAGERSLVIDKSNQWLINGQTDPSWKDCEYIDINMTPFTNSIPINHLSLKMGESREIKAVFIDLIEMKIQNSNQRYTRLDPWYYKYENLDSGFERILRVDEKGIVVDYPGIWKRLNTGHFANVLVSSGPSGELGEAAAMYDYFVGTWKAKVIDYHSDGSKLEQMGEWTFSWVLEGRAMQDVWIVPQPDQRYPEMEKTANRYGTTIRIFDPKTRKWTLTWFNPITSSYDHLEAFHTGNNIIQTGKDAEGNIIRWVFTDMTDNSFRWYGEVTKDGGKTWILQAEFFATRP